MKDCLKLGFFFLVKMTIIVPQTPNDVDNDFYPLQLESLDHQQRKVELQNVLRKVIKAKRIAVVCGKSYKLA
jgi:hypothetical protein